MLTSDDYRLLTAAVDGVLTPAQEPVLRGLLDASDEARAEFRRMTAQSARLARASKAKAPSGLFRAVMAQVAATAIVPAKPAPRPAAGVPVWVAYATAASVLFAVGALALVGRDRSEPDGGPVIEVARKHSLPRPTPGTDGRDTHMTVARADDKPPERAEPLPPAPPEVVQAKSFPIEPEAAPLPRAFAPNFLASAVPPDLKPFQEVEVRLPLLLAVAELDAPDAQARVLAELARDPAFRLDLFARDPHRGAEALQAAAKAAGLTVAVDATAHERMKRKIPSAWALYTEALTAEDVAKLLAAIATHDRAASGGVFGAAHLIPARSAEQRDLKDLLGTDPGLWKRPKPGPNPGQPLSAGTVDQVTANLSKGKEPAKPALFLTYLPTGGRAAPGFSKEVREFLTRRDDRKPGAVPLLVVVRPSAN